jgi:RNA polymerase sigma-70 factor (ECF subfamily)
MQTQRTQLSDFFSATQAKAFRQVEVAVGNRDDALDIVQDAMIRLARKYSDKNHEWPMLFHRILQNLIRDWYRRQKVRRIIVWWDQSEKSERDDLQDNSNQSPDQAREHDEIKKKINAALHQLPYRQQQAFLLRSWWGHDISETAYIMQCSEGSVKTHYSRASHKLKQLLGDIAS